MAHIRRDIRDAVVVLCQGTAMAGGRVLQGQPKPLDTSAAAGGPAIVVTLGEEALGRSAMGAKHERILEVLVTVMAQGEDVEDTLDDIGAEIETAIAGDRDLGGKCRSIVLDRIVPSLTADFAPAGGALQLVFLAAYRTTEAAPATNI